MLSKNSSTFIGLAFFMVLGVLPFVAAVGYAMLYSLGLIGVMNDGLTWSYYGSMLRSGDFLWSLGYSSAIAATSMVISVVSALYLVLRCHHVLAGRVLSFVLYLPLCMPGVVVAFFMTQLLSKAGYLSRLSHALGLVDGVQGFPDLIQDRWAIGILLTFVSVVLPFFVLLFKSVYEQEQVQELEELAYTLGASRRQTTSWVAVRLLLDKTKVLIGLYFIFLIGAYEAPLLLGRESPQMLSVLVVRELNQYDLSQISKGYAIAIGYTIVVSLLTLLLFRRYARSVSHVR